MVIGVSRIPRIYSEEFRFNSDQISKERPIQISNSKSTDRTSEPLRAIESTNLMLPTPTTRHIDLIVPKYNFDTLPSKPSWSHNKHLLNFRCHSRDLTMTTTHHPFLLLATRPERQNKNQSATEIATVGGTPFFAKTNQSKSQNFFRSIARP